MNAVPRWAGAGGPLSPCRLIAERGATLEDGFTRAPSPLRIS